MKKLIGVLVVTAAPAMAEPHFDPISVSIFCATQAATDATSQPSPCDAEQKSAHEGFIALLRLASKDNPMAAILDCADHAPDWVASNRCAIAQTETLINLTSNTEVKFDPDATGQHCQQKWGQQPTMQDFCFNKIRNGYESFLTTWRAAELAEEAQVLRALDMCRAKGRIEWDKTLECAQPHIERIRQRPTTQSCLSIHDDESRLACFDAATGYTPN